MTKAAKIVDTANATGLSFAAASAAIDFYKKDTAKYKQQLFDAYYTQVGYYNDRLSDYAKAIEVLDSILVIAPNEPTTVRYRGIIQKNLDRKNNPAKEPITPKPGVRPKTSGGK
ncbi:MAG: hypothetical protein EAY68_04870 [Bacteroidetes bacterium]|nr:MAG: hypothetical protein EAY68_04870 [Bacteroidota bacterium]